MCSYALGLSLISHTWQTSVECGVVVYTNEWSTVYTMANNLQEYSLYVRFVNYLAWSPLLEKVDVWVRRDVYMYTQY